MRTVTLTLEDVKLPSWNQFYEGGHWSKRSTAAKYWHALVRGQLDPDMKQFTGRVHITVTAYYKGTAVDADNVAAKLLIDGLHPLLIADDSPDYVAAVTTRSRVDRTRERVVIEVREAGQ